MAGGWDSLRSWFFRAAAFSSLEESAGAFCKCSGSLGLGALRSPITSSLGFKGLVSFIFDGKFTNICRIEDDIDFAADKGQTYFVFSALKADTA